jgi:hypothetical protein
MKNSQIVQFFHHQARSLCDEGQGIVWTPLTWAQFVRLSNQLEVSK